MIFDEIINNVYDNSYSITENFVSQEIVESLLYEFENQKQNLKNASVGNKENKQLITEIRSDKIVWLERSQSLNNLFFNKLDDLILGLNRRCYLGINTMEFHFACYEKNTFYKRHKDAFSNDDARKISLILYLNKNWKFGDGGELMIYTNTKEIKVEPKAGTLVVFESSLEHEVLVSNATRISLTGWFKSSNNL